MANLRDTDNFIVSRGTDAHTYTYADVKDALEDDGIGSPPLPVTPIINNVTFAEDSPGGNRFSGKSFTANVSMFSEGSPVSQKEYYYTVEAAFTGSVETDTLSTATPTQLRFNGGTNLNLLSFGDSLEYVAPDYTATLSPTSSINAPTSPDGPLFTNERNLGQTSGAHVYYTQGGNNADQTTGEAKGYSFTFGRGETYNNSFVVTKNGNTWTDNTQVMNESGYQAACEGVCWDHFNGVGVLQTSNQSWEAGVISTNGDTWTKMSPLQSGTKYGSQGYGIHDNRVWSWQGSKLFYSTNRGASWTQLSNPLWSYMSGVFNVLHLGNKLLISGQNHSGYAIAYHLNALDGGASQLSDYTATTAVFGMYGPKSFKTAPHRTAVGNLVYAGVSNDNSVPLISFDQGDTWQQMTTKGLLPQWNSSDLNEPSVCPSYNYDLDTWYLCHHNTGALIFECKDIINGYWYPLTQGRSQSMTTQYAGDGIVFLNGSANKNYVYFYKTSSSSSSHSAGSRSDIPWTPSQQTIQGSSDELANFKVGMRVYQDKVDDSGANFSCFGVIQYVDTTQMSVMVWQQTSGTLDSEYYFENGRSIRVAPEQPSGTVVAGSAVSGSTVNVRYPFSSYKFGYGYNETPWIGGTFKTSALSNVVATRYLCTTPAGEVTGYCTSPEPRVSYLTQDNIYFPTNADTGESWDVELPPGTAITVGVAADNTEGGGGRNPTSGTFDATVTPGSTRSLATEEDANIQEIKFATFPYRKIVFENDLANRRLDLIADLQAQGFTSDQIDDVI